MWQAYLERDGIANELGVFLYDLLDPLLFEVLVLVLFHVEDDVSATPNGLHGLVTTDGERSPCCRLPQILLIIIVLVGKGERKERERVGGLGGTTGGRKKERENRVICYTVYAQTPPSLPW